MAVLTAASVSALEGAPRSYVCTGVSAVATVAVGEPLKNASGAWRSYLCTTQGGWAVVV